MNDSTLRGDTGGPAGCIPVYENSFLEFMRTVIQNNCENKTNNELHTQVVLQ